MWRKIKRVFYIAFVPKRVRHARMRRRGIAALAQTPSVPITHNVALPTRALNEGIGIARLLILKLDHIGDFFSSVEAMCRLRDAWPHAHITLVCDPVNVDLARSIGIFDEIVRYRFFDERFDPVDPARKKAPDQRASGIGGLGLGSYDVAIDLRHDFDTRPCLTYVDARFRVGYATAGRRPADSPVLDLALAEIPPDGPEQLHAATRMNMLAALVIDTFAPRPARQIMRLVDAGRDDRPFAGRRYMVIAPCARSANRTWPLANFIALAQRIVAAYDLPMVVVGSAAEFGQAELLCQAIGPDMCINRAGQPLTDLPDLVFGASLYIGNDTGSTHLAALLGVPTLCIYGGVSDPRVWQPVGPRVALVHSRTPCSYCHINIKEDCPYEQRCMTEIGVDQAFAQVHALLDCVDRASGGGLRGAQHPPADRVGTAGGADVNQR